MKTYVLTVSRFFPATHKRKGEPTGFVEKIRSVSYIGKKLHTIRSNYPLWKKRIEEIQAGKAYLSIRYWEGKPYRSKQIEFAWLGKYDGIGIQMIQFLKDGDGVASLKHFIIDGHYADVEEVSRNDGLSKQDFREWFKTYDLTQPMAIIHFTKFRY